MNLAALLRQRYRMTLNEFQQMLRTQRGLCAICKSLPAADGKGPMGRLHVDHDHVTGRVRALLCASCNNGLGRFKDDPQLLREAAAYIESHAVQ